MAFLSVSATPGAARPGAGGRLNGGNAPRWHRPEESGAGVVGDSGSDPFEGTPMTDDTTPHDATTTAALPAHNRSKVYVDGPGGVRVPFVEVALADSPGREGTTPNDPIRLYDTSGPGSVPTVGLPPLRRPWVTARGTSPTTRADRSTDATTGGPPFAVTGTARSPSRPTGVDRCGPPARR